MRFKDDIRQYTQNQPGWVDVKGSTRPGGGKEGWCKLNSKEDAERAYGKAPCFLSSHRVLGDANDTLAAYARRRGMNVHLFATSKGSSDYRLLRCNCDALFDGVAAGSHSPGRSGIRIDAVHEKIYMSQQTLLPQASGQTAAVPMSYQYQQAYPTAQTPGYPGYPVAQTAAYQPYPMAQASAYQPYAAESGYGYNSYASTMPTAQAAPTPVYRESDSGLKVNVSGGAVHTEKRGIFLSNLSYNINRRALSDLVKSVGRPKKVTLHKDNRTGKAKGTATAEFETKEEAMHAVKHLHNAEHMGMRIRVRLDTESTTLGETPGPVIADGSTPRRRTYDSSVN